MGASLIWMELYVATCLSPLTLMRICTCCTTYILHVYVGIGRLNHQCILVMNKMLIIIIIKLCSVQG